MKPIAISERALTSLLSQFISETFYDDPGSFEGQGLITYENEDAVAIFTPSCEADPNFLAIRRESTGLFGSVPLAERRQVFDKCVRVALRAFGDPVQLNPRWMPYHRNSRISIFAYSEGLGRERLLFDVNARGTQNVYIGKIAPPDEVMDLDVVDLSYGYFDLAHNCLKEAISAPRPNAINAHEGHIELDDVVPADFSSSLTYSEWFPRHLSQQQLAFVNHDIAGPLRLRGAAGTGKTLAMAIKVIKLLYDAVDAQRPCRILFATHSWSGAEMVDQVLRRIDERGVISNPPSSVVLDVYPMLTLAEENRNYAAIGRRPLGIDSSEGKKLSLGKIEAVLSEFGHGTWVTYRSGVSEEFRSRVESSANSSTRKLFCWDLLIEFGCVLAAQGILSTGADKQRYLRMKRSKWMLPLHNDTERQVTFSLWTEFLDSLRRDSLISSDQMVSDYLNELGTFYWEAARRVKGYDYVFVDEMHLFNHQERLVFHNLLSDPDAAPRVVMALDPKQSPRETFTELSDDSKVEASNIYQQARLPNPIRIDFTDVYRYTPQIERVIKCVNEFAPALDLPADWDIPPGNSKMPAGDVPECHILKGQLNVFRSATSKARELVAELAPIKEKVAILCLDDEKFDAYSVAAKGQLPAEIIVIESRDDAERLRYSGKRAILSTPEYVAGLQFSAVILVDANKELVPERSNSGLELRRHLSELYLGISRAQKRLFVYADEEAGGLSDALKRCVAEGAMTV